MAWFAIGPAGTVNITERRNIKYFNDPVCNTTGGKSNCSRKWEKLYAGPGLVALFAMELVS